MRAAILDYNVGFFVFFNDENFQVFGYQMLKKNSWLGLFCHLELL